jgi:NAD(P)-dependent dehydrogenase (short-subunit alcohol dehydrogenase family)
MPPAALITGAGRGIGAAIAEAFAEDGYHVALLARSEGELLATAEKCRAYGVRAVAVPTDIGEPERARAAISVALAQFGRLDVLVNNAGYFQVVPLAEMALADWQRTLDVNLTGALVCTQAVLPRMLERGSGTIINIASMAGKKWYRGQGAYCASKFGLVGMSKVLAAELKGTGVRVTAICPGGVNTKLVRDQRDDVDFSEYMRPETIARLCLFLAELPPDAAIDEVMIRRAGAEPF